MVRRAHSRSIGLCICGVLSGVVLSARPLPSQSRQQDAAAFTRSIDKIRKDLRIPGLSGIVMWGDSIAWEGLLGEADVESRARVTAATKFHLASLTKPFASTIILELVEQGRLSLDDPASKYGVRLPNSNAVLVRHLLSHTSDGVPGTAYRYSGDRYALLDSVIEKASGESFAKRVVERIITPLKLEGTAPNPRDAASFAFSGKDRAAYIASMATGYGLDAKRNVTKVVYPNHFSSAAGLVSTARDVARFAVALGRGQLISDATRELAFTPAAGAGGRALPYGLGWFVSMVGGKKLVWHYGYWIGNSSLIITVPGRDLTLVVLTNSDQLSAPFRLGSGDLMSSPVAREFVERFVTPR